MEINNIRESIYLRGDEIKGRITGAFLLMKIL
jgi:hypothetical protein